MKFIPQPVITGFTAGIAVSIFLSQVKDLLGLRMGAVPAEFFSRLGAYAEHLGDFNIWSVSAAFAGVVIIALLRRWRPLAGDRAVLLLTFALTVMFDLTIAIEVGLVLAAFLFMHRMAEVVSLKSDVSFLEEDQDAPDSPAASNQRAELPPGVEVFQISGPLFFAVANRLDEVLDQFPNPPRVFILRLRQVPLIDASGVAALRQLVTRCARAGTRVIFSGLRQQPREILTQMGIRPDGDHLRLADNFQDALTLALGPPGSRSPADQPHPP